jgi:MoxR-like ATPase
VSDLGPAQAQWFAEQFASLVDNVESAFHGKTDVVRLAITCLLAEGHLLIEDNPGTGKTLLARSIASTIRGSTKRIQFTPDMLPGDVIGVTIFDQESKTFGYRKGPVFANVVLADEINRASPKTQSALLEAMEEEQVTVDGTTRKLQRPFMVIATQNPIEQSGVYALPEAQLDRFLMKVRVGYLDRADEIEVVRSARTRHRDLPAGLIDTDQVTELVNMAAAAVVDPQVVSYLVELADATRHADGVTLGVSTRGCIGLVRAAKVWAMAAGRHFVKPSDVKDLLVPVFGHRIVLSPDAQYRQVTSVQVVERISAAIPPPADRARA